MPDSTIESFVDEIAQRSKIDPAATETAVGTILSVIQQEGNPSKVAQLFSALPGARISLRNTRWSLAPEAGWAEL
jgi:hypothetical protein